MKFQPEFKHIPHSLFIQAMVKRDENIFRAAFSTKPRPGDREWVKDIFELVAEKLNLQPCQVIQAFKLGTPEHLCILMRKQTLDDVGGTADGVDVHHVINVWSWALSLRHPMLRVSEAAGKAVNSGVGFSSSSNSKSVTKKAA